MTRRTSLAFGVALLAAGAQTLALISGGACTRHADIVDEPDAQISTVDAFGSDGNVPLLDADFSSDAFPTCANRPLGACKGANDFPCGFTDWVRNVARDCQRETGCKTNGSVTVKMSPDGCVSAIGMDQPNDEILECLLSELGTVSCPCTNEITSSYYFGEGNVGVCPDAS